MDSSVHIQHLGEKDITAEGYIPQIDTRFLKNVFVHTMDTKMLCPAGICVNNIHEAQIQKTTAI